MIRDWTGLLPSNRCLGRRKSLSLVVIKGWWRMPTAIVELPVSRQMVKMNTVVQRPKK
jgi:hypothetical protein